MRIVMALAVMAVSALGAASAFAQQTWTHGGIAFPPREGWCTTIADQDDGSGGKLPALEARPCGAEFPILSTALVRRGLAMLDLPTATGRAATESGGETGKKVVNGIFQKKDPACTQLTFELDRAPIPGITGFAVIASYNCPALGSLPSWFRNFTAYAQQQNGDLWVVAFDYPLEPITEADKQMISGFVAAISAR